MAINVLERRQMERDAFCRACDKVIKRNTEELLSGTHGEIKGNIL